LGTLYPPARPLDFSVRGLHPRAPASGRFAWAWGESPRSTSPRGNGSNIATATDAASTSVARRLGAQRGLSQHPRIPRPAPPRDGNEVACSGALCPTRPPGLEFLPGAPPPCPRQSTGTAWACGKAPNLSSLKGKHCVPSRRPRTPHRPETRVELPQPPIKDFVQGFHPSTPPVRVRLDVRHHWSTGSAPGQRRSQRRLRPLG